MTNQQASPLAFIALKKLMIAAEPEPSFKVTDTDLETVLKSAYELIFENGENQEKLWLLIYLPTEVVWGRYQPSKLDLPITIADITKVQELRLFGIAGEYYLWRVGASWQARVRKELVTTLSQFQPTDPAKNEKFDESGFALPAIDLEPDVAEEWQILWGTQARTMNLKGWTQLYEERGANYLFPCLITDQNLELPLRLLVRHYLKYDVDSGLCHYQDLRLVEIRYANFETLAEKGEV
jgi:CRISPR-associated protein (TIGR03984 family)